VRGLSVKERFDSKWIPEPFSGCWLWTHYANQSGYGVFGIGSRTDGTRATILAHRMSWRLNKGEIPNALRVLHTCDTPACVNPNHLFLGTIRDNALDMIRKHRKATFPRELNPSAKLTEDNVSEIRRSTLSLRRTARQFGVSQGTIWKIRQNRIWKN
jgi:HNH endonuclease